MTSAVVHNGSSSLEFDSNGVQIQGKENEPVSEYPAVIVEPVPCARVEQGYAAQIFVYDDETYLLQDVAEEQEIETETVKTDCLKRLWKTNPVMTPNLHFLMNNLNINLAFFFWIFQFVKINYFCTL
ncbi:hypothetical protein E2320_007703, partial [Naja naja]